MSRKHTSSTRFGDPSIPLLRQQMEARRRRAQYWANKLKAKRKFLNAVTSLIAVHKYIAPLPTVCFFCGKPLPLGSSWQRKYCDTNCAKKVHSQRAQRRQKEKRAQRRREAPKESPKSPNGLEERFDNLTPDCIRFVGDGSFWVELPNGKRKNPDFRVSGHDKVIELFGDRWHRELRYTDPFALIEMFWRIGIECLIIWESQMREDTAWVLANTLSFIGPEL